MYPDTVDWVDSLPMALLEIRTTLKQDCRCTPAELVYGTTLRIPGEFLRLAQTLQFQIHLVMLPN